MVTAQLPPLYRCVHLPYLPRNGHSRPWGEAQLPPPYRCVYHPGGRFSLAHKNTGVHGADLLSFSGALYLPLPPFEPHPKHDEVD